MDHHLSKLALALEDASKRATSAQHHNKIEIEATRKIENITDHFRRYLHTTQSEPEMTSTPIAGAS